MANATDFVKSNLGTIGAGVGGAVVGGAIGYGLGTHKTKKKNKKNKRTTRKANKKRTKRSFRKTPHTAGKRKDTSHRRIRYTKTGQPYVILASGKARFIKKTSAKRKHKMKGGYY
jgi:membrane protein YqaA with SNARE-associated domain